MDRINHASAPGGVWTNGSPADPSTGTVPQAAWFNDIQEELRAIIVAAGLTPTIGVQDQLLDSLLLKTGITQDLGVPISWTDESWQTVGSDSGTARLRDDNAPLTTRRLLLEVRATSGSHYARIYSTTTGWEFTFNASVTSLGNWIADTADNTSFRVAVLAGSSSPGITLSHIVSGGAWVLQNKLRMDTVTFAKGSVASPTGGSPLACNVTNAVNVTSATAYVAGYITVTFASAAPTDSYTVNVTSTYDVDASPIVVNKTVNGFDVKFRGNGTLIIPTAATVSFDFDVKGLGQ